MKAVRYRLRPGIDAQAKNKCDTGRHVVRCRTAGGVALGGVKIVRSQRGFPDGASLRRRRVHAPDASRRVPCSLYRCRSQLKLAF